MGADPFDDEDACGFDDAGATELVLLGEEARLYACVSRCITAVRFFVVIPDVPASSMSRQRVSAPAACWSK